MFVLIIVPVSFAVSAVGASALQGIQSWPCPQSNCQPLHSATQCAHCNLLFAHLRCQHYLPLGAHAMQAFDLTTLFYQGPLSGPTKYRKLHKPTGYFPETTPAPIGRLLSALGAEPISVHPFRKIRPATALPAPPMGRGCATPEASCTVTVPANAAPAPLKARTDEINPAADAAPAPPKVLRKKIAASTYLAAPAVFVLSAVQLCLPQTKTCEHVRRPSSSQPSATDSLHLL